MAQTLIIACLVVIFTYSIKAIDATTASDVVILLKATDDLDVRRLKQMSRTNAVYKIKPSMNATTWNYAILAKGFPTNKDVNFYVAAVNSLPSIIQSEAISMEPDTSGSVTLMNVWMKAVRLMDKIFGFLPNRPLKPLIPPVAKCDTVDVTSADKQPLTVIAFLRPKKNQGAIKKYAWVVLSKIFPALNARYVYQGYPSSLKTWPFVNIQKYDSKSTLCEYVLSELAMKYADLYFKSYDGMSTYTAIEL